MTIRNKAFLMATAALFGSALGPQAAFAEGTLAGTTLTNSASVSYKVNTTAQTALVAAQQVTVDRKIAFTITIPSGGYTIGGVPGATNAALRFDVANQSNAPLDLAATITDYAVGTAPSNFGAAGFVVQSSRLHEDTNGNGTFDSGLDLQITHIDELAPDAARTVFYVGSIPADAQLNQDSWMELALRAHDGGTTGTLGSFAVATTGADTTGVDTVFADEAGDSDAARDGIYTQWNGFWVQTNKFTLDRYSEVISNPLEGTLNRDTGPWPKALPGAVVEYCMVIDSAGNSSDATNVKFEDVLPPNLTFDTSFEVLLNDSVDGWRCKDTGVQGLGTASYDSATRKLTVNFPQFPGTYVRTVVYRAIVD